ncbi:MAG: hypothetical protein JXA37_08500, partial [Chloroflexia bacterium]|nr:hypothetical protein [Chloroflexia bacterium]
YIKHHLRVAGVQDTPIFSDSFISAVHDQNKGVARKINNIYRNALLLRASEFIRCAASAKSLTRATSNGSCSTWRASLLESCP